MPAALYASVLIQRSTPLWALSTNKPRAIESGESERRLRIGTTAETASLTGSASLALDAGMTVALAPDWTPSGGPNLLSELRYGRYVSQVALAGRLSSRDLVEVVHTLKQVVCVKG